MGNFILSEIQDIGASSRAGVFCVGPCTIQKTNAEDIMMMLEILQPYRIPESLLKAMPSHACSPIYYGSRRKSTKYHRKASKLTRGNLQSSLPATSLPDLQRRIDASVQRLRAIDTSVRADQDIVELLNNGFKGMESFSIPASLPHFFLGTSKCGP